MVDKLITPDLAGVLRDRSIPGLTYWNRLESRPRAESLDRALRAEVRDALWLLTRQWQMGEFDGDDAASPIIARVRAETTTIGEYRGVAGQTPEEFDRATPLEARVEHLPVPFTQGGTEVSLDLRLLMGRYWLKLVTPLVASADAAAVRAQYLGAYPVAAPTDAAVQAHPRASSTYRAATGRLLDGAKLYAYLTGGGRASDGIAAAAGQRDAVDGAGRRFVAWFDRLIYQPAQAEAWQPERLEYGFAVTAPGTAMVANEYVDGHLDWYHLDVDASPAGPAGPAGAGPAGPAGAGPAATAGLPAPRSATMLPTAVTFSGMPNTRWWAFEDGRTNFGAITPDTTDLAKLLLVEFGLVYANDWLLVPLTLPTGALATVRGLAVTDVFGDRTWVLPAGDADDPTGERWALFRMSVAGQERVCAGRSLVNLPSATQIVDGPALDDVTLTRDEMANMVWAIENTIPLPSGVPAVGAEAAYETLDFLQRRAAGTGTGSQPAQPVAAVGYQLMSSVPENWIPMIPVHRTGDVREVQLQRAAMPRLLDGVPEGAEPLPVRPRTWLMRPGLDGTSAPAPYFVYEEEVPRAGARVTRSFRRTRWRDGRAWVWLGARKQTGRGERSSGLAFDSLVDVPPAAPGS